MANFPPSVRGELPFTRPISMGGEEQFHAVVQASKLPSELKNALCFDGVFIGNPAKVVAHLEQMMRDGPDCFQVVADFDATLTRYHRDGKICDSSYGILERSQRMPLSYRTEVLALFDKYYPIELDPNLTIEEKTTHMRDWCFAGHSALLNTKLEAAWFRVMVEESSTELREHSEILFSRMDDHNIPLMIYSAGIGDLILEVLHLRSEIKTFKQTPLIVANFLKFDEKGVMNGFSDELIHVFNKHEIFPHHKDYFAKHEKRRNVLLMGDTLGDLRMADGIPAKDNVVTIGFLNAKIQANFPVFRDNFDIVLIDDQTHDIPISIVEAVTRVRSASGDPNASNGLPRPSA